MSEWISVKERLPENSGSVLVVVLMKSGARFVCTDQYYKEDGWGCDGRFSTVTHWMQLPEPPEVNI